MRKLSIIVGLLTGLLLSGCWTLREPVYPEVKIDALPAGRTVSVQLAGFEAAFTSLVPVYGYAYYWGGPSRRWGCSSPVMTRTFIPRTDPTTLYLDRASETLEKGGCIVRSANPTYRVEVKFEGPFTESGDGWATFGWMVGTLFTAEYGAQNWTAHLKVYDLGTGRLLHDAHFAQRYEALVWGPIPLFSPSGSEKTSENYMQGWCLAALTDKAAAEAMDFFRKMVK